MMMIRKKSKKTKKSFKKEISSFNGETTNIAINNYIEHNESSVALIENNTVTKKELIKLEKSYKNSKRDIKRL